MDGEASVTQTGDMSASDLPQHPISATLTDTGPHQVLALERHLDHEAAPLWECLTQRDRVSTWAPFAPDRDLDSLGQVSLRQTDDPTANANPGMVLTSAVLRMLSLDWAGDRIDIELAPTADGTIVYFSHRFDDRDIAPSLAAGWHLCLQALDAAAGGADVPPVVGDAAYAAGWDELYDKYAKLFG